MNTSSRARGTRAHRKSGFWQAAVLALVLGWPLAACGSAGNGSSTVPPAGAGVPSTATATPGVSGSPTTPANPSTPSAPKSSAPRATALQQLGGFMTKAASMDQALRNAAAAVNAGITAQTINVSARAFAALDAINPHSLVSSLPGGMTTRLKQQSLLVFSDLVARRYAFKSLMEDRHEMPLSALSQDGRMALRGLANGAAPAARFSADLAALRSAASAAPAFTPAAPAARATEEIAVRTAYIIGRNSGCEESGGWVETELLPLIWKQSTDVFGGRTDGTIGGIVFRADYHAGHGWSVQLWAC